MLCIYPFALAFLFVCCFRARASCSLDWFLILLPRPDVLHLLCSGLGIEPGPSGQWATLCQPGAAASPAVLLTKVSLWSVASNSVPLPPPPRPGSAGLHLRIYFKFSCKLGSAARACDPSSRETEAGGSPRVQHHLVGRVSPGQPGLHGENMSRKNKTTTKKIHT